MESVIVNTHPDKDGYVTCTILFDGRNGPITVWFDHGYPNGHTMNERGHDLTISRGMDQRFLKDFEILRKENACVLIEPAMGTTIQGWLPISYLDDAKRVNSDIKYEIGVPNGYTWYASFWHPKLGQKNNVEIGFFIDFDAARKVAYQYEKMEGSYPWQLFALYEEEILN